MKLFNFIKEYILYLNKGKFLFKIKQVWKINFAHRVFVFNKEKFKIVYFILSKYVDSSSQ